VGGCRKSSRPRGARFGAAGVHPHIFRPIGLRAPLAAANRATRPHLFAAVNTYAVNKLGLMPAKSIDTNERLLNELNAGIQFVLYFFKG
jgi:hypothetical protein